MCLYFYLNSIFRIYKKLNIGYWFIQINKKMKDSYWTYMKDSALFSILFIMEVGLIPFYEIDQAYKRTKNKTKS